MDRLDKGIRNECGGELCVELRIEQRDDDIFDRCQFIETIPPQGTKIARGETIVVVSGAKPCDKEGPETSESPDTEASETAEPETSEPEPALTAETSPDADQ